jgi:hypothetical protein
VSLRCLSVLLLLCGCATVPREPPGPPPTRPTERSSLDAILMHQAELQLTELQEKQLHDIDDAREVRAQEATQAFRARVEGERKAEAGLPPSGGSMRGGGGSPGMGGGRGGGMRGGGGRGGMGGERGGGRRGPPAEIEALDAKLDDADTQAFFAAEPLLTPAQLELARKFASNYREALYNWRQAMKHHPAE